MAEHRPKDVVSVPLTPGGVRRVGLELVTLRRDRFFGVMELRVRCMAEGCGQEWSPKVLPGSYLPRLWWHCPNDPEHTKQAALAWLNRAKEHNAPKRRSVRLNESSLKRVGVDLLKHNGWIVLRCQECTRQWLPKMRSPKRFENEWWKCPNSANHPRLEAR